MNQKSVKMSSRYGNVILGLDLIEGMMMRIYVRKSDPELYKKYESMSIKEWAKAYLFLYST